MDHHVGNLGVLMSRKCALSSALLVVCVYIANVSVQGQMRTLTVVVTKRHCETVPTYRCKSNTLAV